MNSLAIKLQRWDEDGVSLFLFSASNNTHSVRHETYCDAQSLQVFADDLVTFPQSHEHEISFESGSKDENYHDYILLDAHIISRTGKSILRIESIVRGDPSVSSNAEFGMAGYPADFNRLGSTLNSWLSDMTQEFFFEWDIEN